MTREEREQALEWFKNRPITMSGAKKMYDLAISALEQPEPCEDTISIQAAIEAAMEELDGGTPYDIPNKIMALPSAETEEVYCPMASRTCFANGKEVAWCLTCPHISEEDRDLVKKAVEPKTGQWMSFEQVADMLSGMFGECACDVNGNDEWLPLACKYADTECPHPKESNGCWMQFLLQGGADMRGEQNE